MAIVDWSLIFDNWGIKRVTPTDKSKSAYVVTTEQEIAIQNAGIIPSEERPGIPFEIKTPLNTALTSVQASFYHSNRSFEADRGPEPRIGRKFISQWLTVGDDVLLGNIGQTLCAIKLASVNDLTTEEVIEELALRSPPSIIFALAKRAPTKPKKKEIITNDFIRNRFVVTAAILRAKNSCEMPGCTAKLFKRSDGSNYLEVHHITPLSENGADNLDNVAALCPHCHREQHHSGDRSKLRKVLKKHIKSISKY